MIPKRAFEILIIVILAWFFLFSLKFWVGLGVGLAFGFWEGLPVGRKD